MQHVQQIEELNLQGRKSVVTMGVFDGLHLGHRHLIDSLVEYAHQRDYLAGVMTFHPHPDEVLHGTMGRYYLTTIEERAELLAAWGVDYLVTHPFNQDVMQIRAADFINHIVRHMNPHSFWLGADFALGHKREGNIAFLTQQGKELGFSIRALTLLSDRDNETVVSSTTIRNALRRGDIANARQLLGRPYAVCGEVVHGEQRGRQLGFPTANIAVPEGKLIPANGVYAGWLEVDGERHMAATNVGYSPTFGNRAVTVEAHILDFDHDIYGKTVKFSFEKFLRPEMKFQGIDTLIAQLKEDVSVGRYYLSRRT